MIASAHGEVKIDFTAEKNISPLAAFLMSVGSYRPLDDASAEERMRAFACIHRMWNRDRTSTNGGRMRAGSGVNLGDIAKRDFGLTDSQWDRARARANQFQQEINRATAMRHNRAKAPL